MNMSNKLKIIETHIRKTHTSSPMCKKYAAAVKMYARRWRKREVRRRRSTPENRPHRCFLLFSVHLSFLCNNYGVHVILDGGRFLTR